MPVTAVGTGRCGEHAAMSFSLLSDPTSLSKLGVQLAEGSMIIHSLGVEIDHNYVLIAAPGAVTIQPGDSGTPTEKLIVHDAVNVVVVDRWMPIPCAHTLSRCNDEILKNPQCKIAVVVKNGKSVLVDNGGEETNLPIPKEATYRSTECDQERHRTEGAEMGAKNKIVPVDETERLRQMPLDGR